EDSFRLFESRVQRNQVRHEGVLLDFLHDLLLAEGKLDAHAQRLLARIDHPSEPEAVDLAETDQANGVRNGGGVENDTVELFSLLQDVVDHPIEHRALLERRVRRRDLDEGLGVERNVCPFQELLYTPADRVAVALDDFRRFDLDRVDAFRSLHFDNLAPGQALAEQAGERVDRVEGRKQHTFSPRRVMVGEARRGNRLSDAALPPGEDVPQL